MEYPKGTKFGNYILCEDGPGKFSIRRQIVLPDGTRKQPRHPRAAYAHFQTKEELEQFVNRLNHRQDEAKRFALQVRSSFIPQALKDEFRDQLSLEIPNRKDAKYQYTTIFEKYFLHFFIHTLKVLDPNQWYKHQSRWGAALLSQGEHKIFERPMSAKTIIKTIQLANRFMSFLHVKVPEEYRPVKFQPISRGAMNAYRAQWELRKGEPDGRYIPPEDWAEIEREAPAEIKPFIMLAYHYGLRRAEALGFENMDSVKKGYLKIIQQMVSLEEYGPVKDRDQRDTPHWFATPAQAYLWIEAGLSKKMHPDTLGARWARLMKALKMPYEMHDLRRTFITRALREHPPRDVQMAVGHASLVTTMSYAMDDRNLRDETYKP